MTYKAELDEVGQNRWELFKNSCMVNRGEKIFKDPANLGNCSVNISYMNGKLVMELHPNETANFEGDVEGVIVDIDENNCHVDSIMKMAENAHWVVDAKQKGLPIKKFN